MKYIILSPKHGAGKKPCFWRANSAGYTESPFNAGVYTQADIDRDPAYFNNGYSAVAIPLTDSAMKKLGFECSYDEKSLVCFMQKAINESSH